MKSFDIEREKIQEIFGSRPGFTDEVIDAITATYIYLDDKYKELVPIDQIPDAKNFKNVTTPRSHYSIAEIYICRLYNNVKSFKHEPGPASLTASQFDHHTSTVYVPSKSHYSWKGRLNSVDSYKTASEEEKQFRGDQIRAKVIVHELLHAGSFNGEFTGFIGTSYVDQEELAKRYGKGLNVLYSALYATPLEELITEELAIEIVGMRKTFSKFSEAPAGDKYKYFKYTLRNPESSNMAINSAGVYLFNAMPEMVRGKFINPMEFLMQFNQTPEFLALYGENGKSLGVSYYLSEWLEQTNKADSSNDKQLNKRCEIHLIVLQETCLNLYLKNLRIETPQDYLNAVEAYENFYNFAVRVCNEKTGIDEIAEPLGELLKKLKQIIMASSKKFSKEEKEELKAANKLNNEEYGPYVHLFNKEGLETEKLFS